MQSLGGAQKPPALVISPELGNCRPPPPRPRQAQGGLGTQRSIRGLRLGRILAHAQDQKDNSRSTSRKAEL